VSDPRPPDEILGYYALGGERSRLDEAYFGTRWGNAGSRERLLDLVRRVEGEPAHLGASPHLPDRRDGPAEHPVSVLRSLKVVARRDECWTRRTSSTGWSGVL
jgi:hypothetical protein